MSLKQKLVKEAMDIYEGKSFDSNAQDLSTTLSGSSEGHITAATKPKKEPPKSVTPKDPKPKTPPPKKNDPVSPRGDGAPTVSSGNTKEAHNRDFAAQITTGRAAAEGKSGKGPDNKTPYGFVDRASSTIKGAKARRVSSGNTVKDHESDAASQIASGRANQEGKGGRSNSFTELSHPVKARTLSDKGKPSIMDKVGRGLASALISRIPIIGDDIAKQMKKDFAKTDAKLASDKKELDKIKGEGNAAFNASRAANQGKGGGSNTKVVTRPSKSTVALMRTQLDKGEKLDKSKPLKGGLNSTPKPPSTPPKSNVGSGRGGKINYDNPAPKTTPKPPPKVPLKAGDGVRKNPVKPVVPKTPKTKMDLGDNGLAPKTTPKKPTTPSFLLKPTVTPAPAKSAMGFTIPKVTPAPAATPAPVKPTTPKKEAPKGTTPPRFTSPATPKTTPKKEAPKKEAPKPTDKQKENKSRLDKMKADKKTTPKKEVPKTTPKPAPKPAPKPTAKQLSNKDRLNKMKADKKTTPKKEAPKPKPKPTAKQVSNKDRLNKMKANKKTTPKKTTPKKQSLGGKIKNFFRRKK